MLYFFNVLKYILEYKTPLSITAGVIFGFLLAFTPTFTLHFIFIFFSAIIFRVNLFSLFLSFIIFIPFYYLLIPFFDYLGYRFLFYSPSLYEVWSKFYSAPFIPYTFFHDTIVFGSFIFSFLFIIPFSIIFYFLLKKKGHLFISNFMKTSIYYWWINTKFYRRYIFNENK